MPLFGRSSQEDEQRAVAYRDWLQRRNPLAIASLVLGIFSFIEMGTLIVLGLAGIALGIVALVQLRRGRSHERMYGQRLAWAGIALSIASLAAAGIIYTHPWKR